MDTNYPAATPREGYPIELSALFARLTTLLDRLGAPASGTPWRDVSARTRDALALYDHPNLGFFADTLHAPRGVSAKRAVADDHLRPNQLFAVSLGFVTGARARAMVDSVARFLLVPGALRTLAPRKVEVPLPVVRDGHLLNDPASPYFGRYEGDEDTHRKPAYHNGTAWPWLLPSFCESLVAAYPGDDAARLAARAILGSTARFLTEGTMGQLPEILDGDAPHRQRGCDAQAWSVTETLRVAIALEEPG
jgi:glycogen debranching enzyme